jgi:hypothetical protein
MPTGCWPAAALPALGSWATRWKARPAAQPDRRGHAPGRPAGRPPGRPAPAAGRRHGRRSHAPAQRRAALLCAMAATTPLRRRRATLGARDRRQRSRRRRSPGTPASWQRSVLSRPPRRPRVSAPTPAPAATAPPAAPASAPGDAPHEWTLIQGVPNKLVLVAFSEASGRMVPDKAVVGGFSFVARALGPVQDGRFEVEVSSNSGAPVRLRHGQYRVRAKLVLDYTREDQCVQGMTCWFSRPELHAKSVPREVVFFMTVAGRFVDRRRCRVRHPAAAGGRRQRALPQPAEGSAAGHRERALRAAVTCPLWRPCSPGPLAGCCLGFAQAQPLPPSPAGWRRPPQPVRVVCIADSAAAFLRRRLFASACCRRCRWPPREWQRPGRLQARGARRWAAGQALHRRRWAPASWSTRARCTWSAAGRWPACAAAVHARSASSTARAPSIVLTLADRLPDRTFQDGRGRPVKLVQALCRDQRRPLRRRPAARARRDKPLPEAQRRRQLDNLLAYAPDLAVLRLQAPARAAPLPLALNQQLDDQLRLVLPRPVPVGLPTPARCTCRSAWVPPTPGRSRSATCPLGGQPGDEVHAKLHRLDTPRCSPAWPGAPVLRGAGVVGVLTGLTCRCGAAGPRLHRRRLRGAGTVLAGFLDLLKVAYTQPADRTAAQTPPPCHHPAGRQQPPAPGAGHRRGPGAAGRGGLRCCAAPPAPAGRGRDAHHRPAAAARCSRQCHAAACGGHAHRRRSPRRTDRRRPHRRCLSCSLGPLEPSVFALPMPNGGTTLFVGRDPQSCQVVFPAGMDHVSAVHACFVWDPVDGSLSPARPVQQRHLAQRPAHRQVAARWRWPRRRGRPGRPRHQPLHGRHHPAGRPCDEAVP